jgi:hypothetical protein
MLKHLLLLLLCLSNLVQAAEDVVVIHSTAQLYSQGQRLDSQTSVNLPAKAEMTVIFANGGVASITGPYQGKLNNPLTESSSDTQLVASLSKFLQDQRSQPALRSTIPASADIWWIDVSTTKRYYCVESSRSITLWRPDTQSKSASTLLIKHKDSGELSENVWPANQTTLKWPNQLPIHYGDTYSLELQTRQRGPTFKKLILYQLPDNLPTASHQVVWMVGRGCVPQANMLLASLR